MLDLINFNADASCLPRHTWRHCLSSGQFHNHIQSYSLTSQPFLIGFTGLTLVDISLHSPATLDLLNNSPNIRHVVRPLVHSLPKGMSLNLRHLNIVLGYAILLRLINRDLIEPAYLPPEFFFRVDEIPSLHSVGCKYLFHCIHRSNMEKRPYSGLQICTLNSPDGSSLQSIQLDSSFSHAYLSSLQLHHALDDQHGILWRDGESPLLIPNGIDRERWFLSNSGPRTTFQQYLSIPLHAPPVSLGYYPLSPLAPWTGDQSNFWFYEIASSLRDSYNLNKPLSPLQVLLVLFSYSSDLVASAAKIDVQIRLKHDPQSDSTFAYTIHRDQRAAEAELIDYLSTILTVNDSDLPLISHECFPAYTHLKDRLLCIASTFDLLKYFLAPASLSRGFDNIVIHPN